MKNKILSVVLIAVVSFGVTACGGTEKPAEEAAQQNVEENNAQTQETAEAEGIDKSLEGIDLLQTIAEKKPEKLMVKSEMAASGMITKMTAYYDGDKTRTEVESPNMPKSILITLPSEGVMYNYIAGESTGYKMIGADSSYEEEMGFMEDDSELLSEVVDDPSEDMIARVENLDGEEVIYIEVARDDEEMGNVLMKMWYSNKYGTILKYQVLAGETTMMELNVTEISSGKIDESLFTPPSNVNFEEVDMGQMMGNY